MTVPARTPRPATDADPEPPVEPRAAARRPDLERADLERPDLERLGRFDEHRVPPRTRDAHRSAHTPVPDAPGSPPPAGRRALRPDAGRPGAPVPERFRPVPRQATSAPSRRAPGPAGWEAPPGGHSRRTGRNPSTPSASGRHADSTHRTSLLDGRRLPGAALAPAPHGRGPGVAGLRAAPDDVDAAGPAARWVVMQGSPARRPYERRGFAFASEDPIDVHLYRTPRRIVS
ncbi:hypothetical protein ACIQF6_29160 [Kitasatospora sp. NPDC092948]|uniref:hypothetical protein n=1 Tax=Kitasatospora sp. NPDC092948 TaxID=3364088 RepID=UPI003803B39E